MRCDQWFFMQIHPQAAANHARITSSHFSHDFGTHIGVGYGATYCTVRYS